MKLQFGSLAALCVVFAGFGFAGSPAAISQDQPSGAAPPPAVLVINREFLKPGKAGGPHEKAESAFVQSLSQAKSPDHYLGMVSLSGKQRALFFHGYDSFADWEKTVGTDMKNSDLSQSIDNDYQADGDLLSSMNTGVFVYQPDKSVGSGVDIAHMRYMSITVIQVRPGHEADWDTLAKLHDSVYGNMPNAHWAMYQELYGAASGGRYLVITPFRSLAELDQHRTAAKQARASASADQRKKMDDLEASTFESIETNLFMFNPKMSYAPDSWKTADPGFWGQQ